MHIYKYAYVKKKCRAPSPHHTTPHHISTLWQQGPTRPTRTYLSASGLPLQRLATLSPCSFEFIGACSNIHKKGTSLTERSSGSLCPSRFPHPPASPPPPELRRIIIRIFKWRGGARRGGRRAATESCMCACGYDREIDCLRAQQSAR